MTHAITELEIALDVRKTNEPINRARGDIAHADLEKEGIEDIKDALNVLLDVGGIQSTLDALGLALTHHGHTWTMDERAGYDLSTSLLKRAGRKIPAATPPEEGWPNKGEAPYIPANVPRQVSLAGAVGGSKEMRVKALGMLFCQHPLCLSGGLSNWCSSKLPTGQRLTARAC